MPVARSMTERVHPILIVDDDSSVTASLSLLLKQAGLASIIATDPDQAMSVMDQQPVSLVVQDMNFSRQTTGEEGLALLRRVQARDPGLPVILITAWGSIQLAVEGMKAGASDFVTKPWNNQHLLQLIRTSLSLAQPEASPAESREELDQRCDFSEIIGEHPALLKVLNTVARVCATDAPVLILGESGTGKELIADALHANSPRARSPLVKVNLGGVPESLFESEMFGHVRGAFTDARSDRKGRFELADGGTIFLDEVGDLDKPSQVKLLRVLQDRSYQPLGASETRQADVRVISATNRDLPAMVKEEAFREDLLYRLNLITVRLPPLRERVSDIRLIAGQHLHRVAEMYGVSDIVIEDAAYRWLESLPWPGNIRQLRQTVERAVLMSGKRVLAKDDFVDPDVVETTPRQTESLSDVGHLTLEEVERLMIEKSLSRNDNNISRAADDLGLSRAALYRRLEKHEIKL
ncbi:MAG: sigma-54 dependent transcriptional regulator [Xanthomonadales bacterium]|nr:sigma-54 dependent transcriptional regulator [Xanthomonadales bacterium]